MSDSPNSALVSRHLDAADVPPGAGPSGVGAQPRPGAGGTPRSTDTPPVEKDAGRQRRHGRWRTSTVAWTLSAIVGLPGGGTLAWGAITAPEILGRPTDTAVVLNAVADDDREAYVEYGTTPGTYTSQTATTFFPAGTPIELSIAPLAPDTRYHYRLRTRTPPAGPFEAGTEHAFRTRRANGQAFTFAVQADSHLDAQSSPELYQRTLANVAADQPDFLIDLGDTFMSEKLATDWPGTVARHLLQRGYFGEVAHSVPLFLVLGNHEGELGWLLDGTPDNLAVWATTARKLYYPNPTPDGFYTGDTTVEPLVGLRESYYAWEWGDALFVVLDPFWHTTTKPGRSGDSWDWTLGAAQYEWLRQTLAGSTARFRFVFIHHLTGGTSTEGRGGIAAAPYYEWGGRNADGSWGFDARRPGWALPIHQLLVQHGVAVVFHGHDHLFAKEDLDGIVYQEVPQPSHPALDSTGNAASYGYTSGIIVSSSGHLRVSVSATTATVEYVRAYLPASEDETHHNGDVAAAYALQSDADADGIADVADPCTVLRTSAPPASPPDQNPARLRLAMKKLDESAGVQKVDAKGFFNPAATAPAIDPALRGVHVRVADEAGVLWEAAIPGGLRGTSACGARDGWAATGAPATRWVYRNATGGLPDGAGGCLAGAAAGIRKITIADRTASSTAAWQFKLAARNASVPRRPGVPLSRVQADVVLATPPAPGVASAQAIAGQCAEFVLAGSPFPDRPPAPYCQTTLAGAVARTIRCVAP